MRPGVPIVAMLAFASPSLAQPGMAQPTRAPPVATAVPTPATAAPDRATCAVAKPHYAGGAPAGFTRLDRQPAAALVLTVARSIDGCLAPIIVRTGIGATARQ